MHSPSAMVPTALPPELALILDAINGGPLSVKNTTLRQTKESDAQIHLLDIPNEIKVDMSAVISEGGRAGVQQAAPTDLRPLKTTLNVDSWVASVMWYMDQQKEGRERGVTFACTTKEFYTDMWHYSPIGLGRSACRVSKIKWKMAKVTGVKEVEDAHSLKSNEMAKCSFQPQQPLVCDTFKDCSTGMG